jgi:hypothetical protein
MANTGSWGVGMTVPTSDPNTDVEVTAFTDQDVDAESFAYSVGSMHAILALAPGTPCAVSYWDMTATTSCEITVLAGQKVIKLLDTEPTYPDITFFLYRNGVWLEVLELFQYTFGQDIDYGKYLNGDLQPPPSLQKGIDAASEVVNTLKII